MSQQKKVPSLYVSEEHDACGVGFLARLDGAPNHEIVAEAVSALERMAHRGGACFGPSDPDGAGLLLPIPVSFMRKVWRPLCGELPDTFAIGQFFLPDDDAVRRELETLAEKIFSAHGLKLLGWRDTPVRKEILGAHALATCPAIRQCLVVPDNSRAPAQGAAVTENAGDETGEAFERLLYIARRHLENSARAEFPEQAEAFHVASLSGSSLVYKGLLHGGKLSAFYQDLTDRDFAVHFAVLHERYSTNTQPAWRLAQPFHCLAHNGEINTIACNRANMAIREPLLASPLYGEDIRHLLPVLDSLGSDSAMLDNSLEFLLHGGRSLAHAAMMLVPEPFGSSFIMGEDKRAFYEYHAAFMEPWDGPSALVFTDGRRQLGAMLDRNALRPCRYAQTKDGLFILASEAGVLDLPDSSIARRGRLNPRNMIMIDFARKRVLTDAECKGRVIYAKPYRHWVREKGLSLRDLPLMLPGDSGGARVEGAGLSSSVAADCGAKARPDDGGGLLREQRLFGYSREDISDILLPMARDAQEPICSMGLDAPLAVLSARPQPLFSYFKQRFAQVTNPPIDPLREGLVMTLSGFAGKCGNILEEGPQLYTRLRLSNPLLTSDDLLRLKGSTHPAARLAVLPMLFDLPGPDGAAGQAWAANQGGERSGVEEEKLGPALEAGLERLFAAVDAALEARQSEPAGDDCAASGPANLILLSDAGATPGKAPIPSLLAVAGLHHHLLRRKMRHACSILVDTGEARDVMQIAQLIAFGASAVHPRLALATVGALAGQGQVGEGATALQACTAYANAVQKGLLKTFSRMGISTLRSFMGGQGFEALGLSAGLVDKYFTGVPSRIGGIGLRQLAAEARARHAEAFGSAADSQKSSAGAEGNSAPAQAETGGERERLAPSSASALPDISKHKYRKGGERHLWTPSAVRALHKAVRENDWESYREYARESDEQAASPVTLRGLLRFSAGQPVDISRVEPVEAIMRRFVGAAMSYGSISPEAHEAIAVACNRVGARSNCGEGGEGPERLLTRPNGDDPRSRVRQIASGRFGVTAAYLVNADEIQIKVAQGAKPGEGGQLPAHKVLPDIARVRHTIPGVTLVSPPPHHDIYSIEDLAQLIFDLKTLHPGVKVSVKLVSGSGVGTVAAGVAKAGADGILISGHDGGTGASPRSAMEYVGLPWELGLAETHAALSANGLRGKVSLQTDGQLRTGRDLAMAALLGAEEFGLGTSALVALGCCMLRVCHKGTCAAGIATQSAKLRARFCGSPDHLERYFRFLAQDLREHMAGLGFCTVEEMLGRADRLEPAPLSNELPRLQADKIATLDLAPVLRRVDTAPADASACGQNSVPLRPVCLRPAHRLADSALNLAMLNALRPGIVGKYPCRFDGFISNTDRAAGSRVAGEIARLYGEEGLPPGSVHIDLSGVAGQSAGAFLTRGMFMFIKGEVNDYAGKGLSGGVLAVKPSDREAYPLGYGAGERPAAGNVALYGATSGEAYFAGTAGERFAVRNSGAQAVVEGVGDHGCEYMTGGTVVVLGSTGYNFAAGMSGGAAYVYDPSEQFQTRCNMDGVGLESVWRKDDVALLRSLLSRHERYTGSRIAAAVLEDWENCLPLFLKVTPIEYRKAQERLRRNEGQVVEQLAATEEVYDR